MKATSAPKVTLPAQHFARAVPDQQRKTERGNNFYHRKKDAVIQHRIQVRVAVLLV